MSPSANATLIIKIKIIVKDIKIAANLNIILFTFIIISLVNSPVPIWVCSKPYDIFYCNLEWDFYVSDIRTTISATYLPLNALISSLNQF